MIRRGLVAVTIVHMLCAEMMLSQTTPLLIASAGSGEADRSSPWSTLQNPACIPIDGVPVVAVWGEHGRRGLNGLVIGGAALYSRILSMDMSVALSAIDYESYHDMTISLGSVLSVAPDLYAGLRAGGRMVFIPGAGSTVSPVLEMGAVVPASHDLGVAVRFRAVREPRRPTETSLVIAWTFEIDGTTRLLGALRGSSNGSRTASLGFALAPSDDVAIRVGAEAPSGKAGVGVSIATGPSVIDVAVASTATIGIQGIVGAIVPLR